MSGLAVEGIINLLMETTMFIATETFAAESTETHAVLGTIETGTVEVTLRRKTQRVPARRFSDGRITAMGLTGRYQTGSKAWPATISQQINGKGELYEHVWFGRDDRSGRFNKENCIYFA